MKKQTNPAPYEFFFNLGDNVKVKNLSVNGKVTGIFIQKADYITYRVRFFNNFEEKLLYFYPDELELINDEKVIGFKQD